MIIINENNYPIIIMIFDKFYDLEYKTFIKNLEFYNNKIKNDNLYFTLYIDLYNLNNYSYQCFTKLLKFLYSKYYSTLNTVNIYFNKKNTNYIAKSLAYTTNIKQNNFIINIFDIDKPIQWSKKIIK